MAKTYLNQAKYIIRQSFEIKGVVDKHDIIGAIFGQSEGLIGEDLDIRELQSAGKIGRIELELASEKGVTKGTLTIPSGADMVETAILASTIEVVDKVGPCDAFFKTDSIEDTRGNKRKQIVNRAKELLANILNEEIPDSLEITNEVRADIQTAKVVSFGPDKLAAGPAVEESDEIILVEGRADVLNLLKYNIKNAIAMGGSKIPQSIIDLTKKKTVTAFLDGDRGGALDLKKLLQIAEIDFIARAPMGLEVEELAKKQILAALNKRIPVAQTKQAEDLDLGDKYWEEEKDLFSELDIEVHEKTSFDDKPKPSYQSNQSSYQGNNYSNNNSSSSSSNGYQRNSYHNTTNRYDNRDNRSNTQDNRGYRSNYQNPKYEPRKEYGPKQEYKPEFTSYSAPKVIVEKPVEQIARDVFDDVKPSALAQDKNVDKTLQESISKSRDFDKKVISKLPEKEDPFKVYPLNVKKNMDEIKSTFNARFFDKDGKLLEESKVKDILKQVKDQKNCSYLLFDGIITKRLVELSKSRGVLAVIGSRKGKMDKVKGIEVFEYDS